ncbi:MAG: aconitase X, partial [Acidobacteriota bacterium]|nr:aconitase X [Acidobacteriota bacterium]
ERALPDEGGCELVVTTSRAVRDLVERAGLLAPLHAFGGRLMVDTCVLATPMTPGTTRRLMTNSAKYAWYSPGLLGSAVAFGSLAECVESARQGRVVREPGPWDP